MYSTHISFIDKWNAKALLDEGKEKNCNEYIDDSKSYTNIQSCCKHQIVPQTLLEKYGPK